jgi:cell wall-associated NlpC family hydrolase
MFWTPTVCQSQGVPWFKDRGLWREPSYIPSPGDIVFFDWGGDGISDHVGIVESVDGEYIHTIEGNTSDSVARRTYRPDSASIQGYGVPIYG